MGSTTLKGTQKNDSLKGGSKDDILEGLFGDDTLSGGSGDDTLSGGFGDDLLNGDFGDDFLDGGEGDDTLIGYDPEVTEFNGRERDFLTGGPGNNTFLTGDSDRNYYGAEGRYAIISDFDNPESVDNRIQLWGGEEYEYRETQIDDGRLTSGLGIFGAGDSPLVVLEGFDASDASSLIASDEGALTFIEFDV